MSSETNAAGLRAYLDRRAAVMLALGFASGLPNLLIFDTLSAWMRDAGLPLATISFFSLATLAYSFKFLWAPVVDRTAIPGLTAWLGHRRSWMLVAQVVVAIGLVLIALGNPGRSLGVVAICAVITGFASATQDIVVDAWRIEAAPVARQGAMAAAYQWGYRIAMIVAGAAPLILADHYGWPLSYGAMAGLMVVGVAAVLGAPRETAHVLRPLPQPAKRLSPAVECGEWIARLGVLVLGGVFLGSGLGNTPAVLTGVLGALRQSGAAATLAAAWSSPALGVWLQLAAVITGGALVVAAAWPIPRLQTRPGLYLSHAFGDPLGDFFGRFGRTAVLILALICVYRLSDFVLNIMTPFYLDLGFTKTQVAEARKVFGVVMSLIGVFAGGYSVAKLGLMRSVVIGAVALPITNTIFAWLATRGPDFRSLLIAIGVDNVVSGYAGTCLIAYMSSLTSTGFTATQYALFSSLYSLPGKLIASQSGRIVEGSAKAAQAGGFAAPLRRLFAHAPPEAFAGAMAKSHVAPDALGAGYVVFFLYSGLIGLASMALAAIVARRSAKIP